MYDVSMTKPSVGVKVARTGHSDPRVALPAYETPGASGMDVRANLNQPDRKMGITIAPGGVP